MLLMPGGGCQPSQGLAEIPGVLLDLFEDLGLIDRVLEFAGELVRVAEASDSFLDLVGSVLESCRLVQLSGETKLFRAGLEAKDVTRPGGIASAALRGDF